MSTHQRFDVLLFDLGGVLIDFAGFDELSRLLSGSADRAEVRRRWIASPFVRRFERAAIPPETFARGVLGELGLEMSPDDSIPPETFARGVLGELGLEMSPDDFFETFVDWARGLYPGAGALLRRLRPGPLLACLSNSNRLHTPLHRRSVAPFLERLYFSDEIGLVKPEPQAFRHVISDLAVPASRIAFFDDTEVNVAAARAAGMAAFEVDGLAALEARLLELGALSREPAP
jgi:putative hydrolase of the HAD superfamily